MSAYVMTKDNRFRHALDVIEHIEYHNCAHGCRVPSSESIKEWTPGGDCDLLGLIAISPSGTAIHELEDDGETLICKRRMLPHGVTP